MTPVQKGCIVGALNAPFIAGIAISAHHAEVGVEMVRVSLVLTLMLAAPGVGIGAVAGAIAGRVRRFRLPALAAVAFLGLWAVAFLLAAVEGSRTIPRELGDHIVGCCIPTVALAAVLERWTRADVARGVATDERALSSIRKGVLLGALDAVAIVALAIAWFEPDVRAREIPLMFVVGATIGVFPGALIGAVAGAIAGKARRYRFPVVAAGACALLAPVVLALAWLVGAPVWHELRGLAHLWLLFAVPTLVMASILERWTRRDVASPVPSARVVT